MPSSEQKTMYLKPEKPGTHLSGAQTWLVCSQSEAAFGGVVGVEKDDSRDHDCFWAPVSTAVDTAVRTHCFSLGVLLGSFTMKVISTCVTSRNTQKTPYSQFLLCSYFLQSNPVFKDTEHHHVTYPLILHIRAPLSSAQFLFKTNPLQCWCPGRGTVSHLFILLLRFHMSTDPPYCGDLVHILISALGEKISVQMFLL